MMRNWQPYAKPNATAAEVADLYGTLTPAPMITWDDVRTIRRTWPGALVIKGLLHPGDVEMAARLGADGVVVSNHGGRQLDKAPAPVEVLSEIRTVAAGRLQIILIVEFGAALTQPSHVALGLMPYCSVDQPCSV